MHIKLKPAFYLLILCCILASCTNQGPFPLEDILRGTITTTVNPHGKVPLGAQLRFTTQEDCSVEIEIEGNIPLKRKFSTLSKFHEIPVIGLYPNQTNQVNIKLLTADQVEYTGSVSIQTEAIPEFLPTIEIVKKDTNRMEPGFHLIDMLIANNGKFLTYTIFFDNDGVIRWFMDMSSTGQITYTSHRLKNGNWLYLNWIDLIEVDDLGQIVKAEKMWGHAGNHEVIELPDGRLLMGGSKKDAFVINRGKAVASRYDFVIIWDRKQNRTVKEWDLRQVLDVDRSVFIADYAIDQSADWFHLNSIALNPNDNSLLVSGRHQGVLKVDQNNQLKWILAPHKA